MDESLGVAASGPPGETFETLVRRSVGFQDGDGPVAQAADMDSMFVLLSGYLVFFMQCGFCMLCAGSVRGKNAKNVILKNLLDTCIGALGWYVLGYGLAFGERANEFLGESSFALHDVPHRTYHNWMFQYAFAATATTIVSGAVAERTKFEAYLVYAFFLTSWVYPSVVHWIWAEEGWLTAFKGFRSDLFNGTGLIDFAGCGVVHMVGGLSGLAGAWMVGPRLGRFDVDGKPREIPGHSASLALLGVFILWFGWYGFNPGSALAIVGASDVAALCAVNTTLAASSGCISALLLSMLISYYVTGNLVWDVIGAGNGALAGLVSITASCSVVQPWAALVIGFIGGFVYVASSNFVLHVLKVDDPLDAIAVHAFCGMWGLVATGSFADVGLLELSYPPIKDDASNLIPRSYGWAVGGDGRLLVSAIVGIVVILGWALIHMVPFFALLKVLGLLRVLPEQEHEGLDISHHGGSAYPKEMIRAGSWGSHRDGGANLREMKAEMASMKDQMSQLQTLVMEAVEKGQLGDGPQFGPNAIPGQCATGAGFFKSHGTLCVDSAQTTKGDVIGRTCRVTSAQRDYSVTIQESGVEETTLEGTLASMMEAIRVVPMSRCLMLPNGSGGRLECSGAVGWMGVIGKLHNKNEALWKLNISEPGTEIEKGMGNAMHHWELFITVGCKWGNREERMRGMLKQCGTAIFELGFQAPA